VSQGTSSTATTIENAATDADISAAVPLGTKVEDSTTVTGSPVAFTPTGTVTYEFFTTIDGTGSHVDETVTLSGGVVPESSVHGPLTAGSYSFIAIYSGDSNYAGSTGAVEPLTVSQGTSSTATTSRTRPRTRHQRCGAVGHQGGGQHDGDRQSRGVHADGDGDLRILHDHRRHGTHVDETVTLAGGVVPESAAHGPLAAGSYSFIAIYSGDSNYAGSTGAVEPLTVSMGTSSTATTIENFTSDADISAAVPLGTTVNDSTTVTAVRRRSRRRGR